MKRIVATFIIIIFTCIILKAQTIYIPCSADALVNINSGCPSWQTSNYGTITIMQASSWTWYGPGCADGNIHSFVFFNMNLPPDNHRIYDDSAMLYLYYPTGSNEYQQYISPNTDNEFYVQLVTSAWGEMTVTWNNQPSITTAGEVTVPSCNPNPDTQDYQVDISGHVLSWLCNGVTNYGLRLILVNEGVYYRRVTFASREFSDTTKHPRLAVKFARIAASAPDSVCSGNPFNLSCSLTNASNPGVYQFQWTHLNTSTTYPTQNVVNPAFVAGINTYVVTATNPWCQSATDTVRVFVSQLANVSASYNSPLCAGANLNLNASGGTIFQWSGPNGFSSTLQSPVISGAGLADTGIYTVTVSNGLGCNGTASVAVTINALPNASAASNSPVCAGQTLNLTSGGGTIYAWSGPNSFSSSSQNTSVTGVSPAASGNYTVTVTAAGCSSTAATSVIVNTNPVPSVTLTPIVICVGEQDTLTATGANSYTWTPSSGLNTTSGSIVIADPASSITYTVTGTTNGCTGSSGILVTVNPAIVANAGNHVYVCAGDSVQLNASGGTTYSWTPAAGMNNPDMVNPEVSPSSTTVYTVTVSNGICIPATDTVTVSVKPDPTALITGDTLVCPGTAAILTASGGNSYYWSNNANTAVITVTPLVPTTYSVTVTNLGCTDIAAATVYFLVPQAVDAGPDTSIFIGETIQLNATGGTSWTWTPATGLSCTDCFNPVASPSVTTTYSVMALDSNGCESTDNITITVDMNCNAVYIPDIFSPNGDNNNDVLYVRGNCIENMDFIIYDRWGEKVFTSSSPQDGWDGKFRGKPMEAGVFMYNLKANLYNGTTVKRKGSITLIR